MITNFASRHSLRALGARALLACAERGQWAGVRMLNLRAGACRFPGSPLTFRFGRLNTIRAVNAKDGSKF